MRVSKLPCQADDVVLDRSVYAALRGFTRNDWQFCVSLYTIFYNRAVSFLV